MKTSMMRTALLGLLCSVAMTAFAQWTWIESDGRKVFSDRPPPPEVAEKNILRRPNGERAAPAANLQQAAGAASSAANPATPAKPAVPAVATPTAVDKEMADKLKKAEATEAARKKAEQSRVAAAKADNCQRAKQSKANYTSGLPIARINSKGERELMDDASRSAETRRLDAIIASDCR